MLVSELRTDGSITLPAEVLQKLRVRVGERLAFIEKDEGYVLIPILSLQRLLD